MHWTDIYWDANFFNSTQQVIFFCLVYKHTYTYFIHYKWLLNIPYNVSLYYLINVITNKTCFTFSVFR